MVPWHLAAIVLTVVLVVSGGDWQFFLHTRSATLRSFMFPSVYIGFLTPIWLPLLLIGAGTIGRASSVSMAGWAIGQAEAIGAAVAAFYKALTGRVHPSHTVGADLSHAFRFGLLRGGVFWGWPSSHTTIAFAMAAILLVLFPKRRWLGCTAFVYAFYIGLGVSITIHWLSDFTAGAIFGTAVGVVVARSFRPSETATL